LSNSETGKRVPILPNSETGKGAETGSKPATESTDAQGAGLLTNSETGKGEMSAQRFLSSHTLGIYPVVHTSHTLGIHPCTHLRYTPAYTPLVYT